MTGENGYPVTPDWHGEPKPNPFDVRSIPDTEPNEDHLIRGTE